MVMTPMVFDPDQKIIPPQKNKSKIQGINLAMYSRYWNRWNCNFLMQWSILSNANSIGIDAPTGKFLLATFVDRPSATREKHVKHFLREDLGYK